MRKLGYLALCLYLLLVGLTGMVPNLLVPSMLLSLLAVLGSFGIFLDLMLPSKGRRKNMGFDHKT